MFILGSAWHTFLFLGFAFGGFLFATTTAAVGSFWHWDAVHASIIKIAVYFWLILLALCDTNKTYKTLKPTFGSLRIAATVQTDERFRLLLNPPSLIFRGATFLVLTLFFFSCGLDAGFDFLRALGPANTNIKTVTWEFNSEKSYDILWSQMKVVRSFRLLLHLLYYSEC